MRPLWLSAIRKPPPGSAATSVGAESWAAVAGPPSPEKPPVPFPATVAILPWPSTRRTRSLAVSATRKPPPGSGDTPCGAARRAAVAGPPSPPNARWPLPATVEIVLGGPSADTAANAGTASSSEIATSLALCLRRDNCSSDRGTPSPPASTPRARGTRVVDKFPRAVRTKGQGLSLATGGHQARAQAQHRPDRGPRRPAPVHRLGHRDQDGLRRGRRRLRPRGAPRRARRVPVHPRRASGHVPQAQVDDAPVRGLRHRQGDQ